MSAATPGDNPLHLPALYTPRASKQVAIYPIDGFFLFPPEREQCCNGASQPELSWNQGIASESRQIIMNGGAYGRGGKINTKSPFSSTKNDCRVFIYSRSVLCLLGRHWRSVFIWRHQYFEIVFQARACCWSAQSN